MQAVARTLAELQDFQNRLAALDIIVKQVGMLQALRQAQLYMFLAPHPGL
jgi:hypothetical protein